MSYEIATCSTTVRQANLRCRYSFFFHRARAAFFATLCRCLAVIVLRRRFPPTLPPLLPIAAMYADREDDRMGSVPSVVDSSTRRCANWFTSCGRLSCLSRFGIQIRCHAKRSRRKSISCGVRIKVAHYPMLPLLRRRQPEGCPIFFSLNSRRLRALLSVPAARFQK